jgi:hypothetical protein
MRLSLAVFLFTLISGVTTKAMASAQIADYGGEVRLISLSTGQSSKQKLVMTRTVDPSESLIIEDACIQSPGQPAQRSPTYILISGDTATLSDSPPPATSKTFTGTGALYGKAWSWNYLKYTIHFPLSNGSLRIEDDNFITPTQFIARKQLFFTPTGGPPQSETPVQLWDAELHPLTPQEFQAAFVAMGCK